MVSKGQGWLQPPVKAAEVVGSRARFVLHLAMHEGGHVRQLAGL